MTITRYDPLAALARLGPDDLRRVSRLVDLLVTAPRVVREEAQRRLHALPAPDTHEETRERIAAVCSFIETRHGVTRNG